MCKGNIHELLLALPKCEHHIHIEGALTPSLLFKLAARNSIHLASADDQAYANEETLQARYGSFASLSDFIRYFSFGSSVLVTAEDFEELASAYFIKAHEQNVKHAEVFFDPQAHTSRGVTYATVVQGLSRAKQKAEQNFDMSIEYIPCILRHHGLQSAIKMFDQVMDAGHFENGTVAGLGMAGDELVHPPEYFETVYNAARTAGVRRTTAHVGQAGPATFVSAALDHLKTNRVDHAWIAKTDSQLMQKLAEAETLVTLCPISNVTLGFIGSIAEAPIRDFLDRGVQFSVNSDDPAYFDRYIQENYCAVQEAFDLNESDWNKIALNAVEGSWCSDARKQVLREQVAVVISSWQAAQDV